MLKCRKRREFGGDRMSDGTLTRAAMDTVLEMEGITET